MDAKIEGGHFVDRDADYKWPNRAGSQSRAMAPSARVSARCASSIVAGRVSGWASMAVGAADDGTGRSVSLRGRAPLPVVGAPVRNELD